MTLAWHWGPPRTQGTRAGQPFKTWAAPDGSDWARFYRVASGFLIRFEGIADFEVASNGQTVWTAPVLEAPAEDVGHLFLNQIVPLALSQQGHLVLHGSAIEWQGGALAFVGPTGRGKSTLVASLARAGYPFVSDDALQVRCADAGALVFPGHPSLRLWSDSQTAVLPDGKVPGTQAQFTPKLRFATDAQLPRASRALPLRAVYVLDEPGGAGEVGIEALSASDGLIELARNTFLLDTQTKPSLARHFEQVHRLCTLTGLYRFRYPRRYEDLDFVQSVLFAHAAAPHQE